MSNERLLPCPFCGGEATIHKSKFGYGVMCKTPFCCYLTSTHDTKKEAIKTWNTRKPMERIVGQLEEARKKIIRLDSDNHYLYKDGADYMADRAIEIVKGGV